MAAFDILVSWAKQLTQEVADAMASIRAIQAVDVAQNTRIAQLASQVAEQGVVVNALNQDLASLQDFLASLNAPATFRVVIDTLERNPLTMAFQIADNDTTKKASVEVDDALGLPVDQASNPVTVVFSTSDPSVAVVDATTGAISPATPPKLGPFQVQAAVTKPDGTVLTGTPADCEIVPGPAATFKVVVG
jgi:hypothetical protein